MNYFCFIFVCIYHPKCIRSQNMYNSILLFFSFYLNHCCHTQFLYNNFKSCIKYHFIDDDLFCQFLLLNIIMFLYFYFCENVCYPSFCVFVIFLLNKECCIKVLKNSNSFSDVEEDVSIRLFQFAFPPTLGKANPICANL